MTKKKEYIITTPATPLPWINYLGNEDFFSLISNTCGGYSFYKDAKLLRLTRYRYNTCLLTRTGGIILSIITEPYGLPGGSQSRRPWIPMSVIMDSGTADSFLPKMESMRT